MDTKITKIIIRNKNHEVIKEISLNQPGNSRVRHFYFVIYYRDGSIIRSPEFSIGPVNIGGAIKYVSGLIDVVGKYGPMDIEDESMQLEYHRTKLHKDRLKILVDEVICFNVDGWTPSNLEKIKKIELRIHDTALLEI